MAIRENEKQFLRISDDGTKKRFTSSKKNNFSQISWN